MPPAAPGKIPAPPPLDGELRFDEVTRNGHVGDFGHIVHRVPGGVLRPGSADDVAKTIRWAAPRGGRFAPQGRRHSTFGRSQVPGGIVADMSTLRSIGPVDGDRCSTHRVRAVGGAVRGDVGRHSRSRRCH